MPLSRTIRSLRRSPGATALAVLSLGVGIGLSTAAIALIESFHRRDVPFARPDELVRVSLSAARGVPLPSALDQLEAIRALPGVTAAFAVGRRVVSVDVNGKTDQNTLMLDQGGFFDLLGVRPRLGRFPDADERRDERAIVVTDRFWRENFPNRDDLTNAFIVIDGLLRAIVGVLPAGYENGDGIARDLWLPMASDGPLATGSTLIIARVPSPDRRAGLQVALNAIAARYASASAAPAASPRYGVWPLVSASAGGLTDFDYSLLVAGGAVLLIACVNVMVLTLSRGLARRRDFALRRALGASPASVAAEVWTEVGVLAAAGAVLGGIVAAASLYALARLVPPLLLNEGFHTPEISIRVFLAAAASVLGALAVSGAAPAWFASRVPPNDPLKENAGTTTGRAEKRFRGLIIAEFSAAMLLMFGSALMTRSAQRMAMEDCGYAVQRLQTTSISMRAIGAGMTAPQRTAMITTAVDRIRGLDEVASASLFAQGPSEPTPVFSDASPDPVPVSTWFRVGDSFFATTGIAVVAGRDFDPGDQAGGTSAILSQLVARALFGSDQGAVGRAVRIGNYGIPERWLTVIGVVRDVPLTTPRDPEVAPSPLVFVAGLDPMAQKWSIAVRPRANGAQAGLAINRALAGLLPAGTSFGVEAWGSFEERIAIFRFIRNIFGSLGIGALILGAVGIFSVFSFAVGQRTREFGVRVALGSSPRGILSLVLRGAVELTLGGIAIGLLLSIRSAEMLAVGVQGLHGGNHAAFVGTTLAATIAVVLAVTGAAALVPALRASRVDPVTVLRSS